MFGPCFVIHYLSAVAKNNVSMIVLTTTESRGNI